MAVVSMKSLLEAGVHFGHQTRRWNPKMAPYIYTERNGIYIIDLQKTVKKIEEAYNFVRDLAANGENILFVGTKKQAQDAIKEEAERVDQYYVNARWLGGMLTNFKTMRTRIDRLAQAKEDPKNATKPDAIIEKIVMGGIGKYFKEICLLQQPFVKDDKVSVEEHIAAVAKQVGASIKLVGYTRFEKGEGIEKRQDDLAEEVAKLVK